MPILSKCTDEPKIEHLPTRLKMVLSINEDGVITDVIFPENNLHTRKTDDESYTIALSMENELCRFHSFCFDGNDANYGPVNLFCNFSTLF